MDLQLINKKPEIGDYVFVSRWSDRLPSDPWYIGILEYVNEPPLTETSPTTTYKVADVSRLFPCCQVITPMQGLLILGFYLGGADKLSQVELRNRVECLKDPDVITFFFSLMALEPF